MIKIGILGGTFDPIHKGHIYLAETVMEICNLDEILFLHLGIPPHKKTPLANAQIRYRLIEQCIKDIPGFSVSNAEINRQGTTYTIDTLSELKAQHPNWDIYYIIGSDTLFDLEHWKNISNIFKICTFICMSRPGNELTLQKTHAKKLEKQFGGKIIIVPIIGKSVSSTLIRNSSNEDLYKFVPEQILSQVKKIYAKEETEINRQELLSKLKPLISEKRYHHTLNTEKTAIKLAELHGFDTEKASVAALLHDCAKGISKNPEEFCKNHHISEYLHDYDDYPLPVLHAPMGAHLAQEEFHINDPEILSAITWHTSGKPNMSLLDKIIYLADYTEPGRNSTPQLEEIRSLANTNLDMAMLKALEYSIERLKAKNNPIHYTTLNAYNYMKEQMED